METLCLQFNLNVAAAIVPYNVGHIHINTFELNGALLPVLLKIEWLGF